MNKILKMKDFLYITIYIYVYRYMIESLYNKLHQDLYIYKKMTARLWKSVVSVGGRDDEVRVIEVLYMPTRPVKTTITL